MSEAQPVGASGAPAPTNGATDPVGSDARSPEATPAQETPASPEGAGRDYLALMKESPEKADALMRQFQGDKDRADAELRSFQEKAGPLLPYLQSLGGEEISKLLTNYATLRTHPAFQQHILSLETNGSLPTTLATEADPEGDEFVDPEVKALRDQIAEQDLRLEQLTGRLEAGDARAGMSDFKSNVAAVLGEWPDLTGEDRDKVVASMEQDIAGLPVQTVVGLKKEGVETLLIKSMMRQGVFHDVSKRRVLREEAARQGSSTAVPPGGGGPLQEKPSENPTALEAFREGMELAKQGRL